MAINEVKFNGQVLLTTRGDTVTKATLIEDETATNKAGEKIKGEAHIPEKVSELENDVPYAKAEDIPTKLSDLENDTNFVQEENTYLLTDEEGDIADNDYIPFNDVSDTNNSKKKTLFSNIVDNIKNKFLGIFWAVAGGTEIPANADLNNYKNVGNYIVNTTSIALTISNIPTKDAGRMIVVNTTAGTSYRTQLYYPYNANYNFTRYTVDGGLTWSNWIASYAGIQGDSHVHNYRNGLWWSQFKHKINGDKHLYLNFSKDGGSTWDGDSKIPLMSDILPHTYKLGTEIPTGSDFNDYKTEGVFFVKLDNIASNILNMPVAYAGKLVVSKTTSANNYISQLFLRNASSSYYSRFYNPNADLWSEWKQLASTDDISPANIGNGYAVATVSGSAITATISGFKLRAGAIVALYIPSDVTIDCTLNINSTGAKSIKTWNGEIINFGHPLFFGIHVFIYDGAYYRTITHDRTPRVGVQNYVADTSGIELIEWGYGSNRAQIKHNIGSNKLAFNYYKNSAWRGDYNLVDEYGRQTMSGWLGLKTNGGRTIASGAHSLAVSDTIPNILNELRFSNGAWGSFNLTTAYTKNYTTIPTGWYNYFYIPHRVGGENWAKPTTWGSDNVDYGTLMLFGMNNTNGMFRIRMSIVSDAVNVSELEDLQKGNCYVGTCATEGATKDKVATVDGNFVLRKGVRVAIKFTNNNTYNSQPTSSVTLNVNNTGAKNIWYGATHSGAGNTGTRKSVYGYAGQYIYYIYDGIYWVWEGNGADDNTYSAILSAGATQVTFTGLPTSGDYLNDIYTSKAGLNYKSIDDSTSGQLKVTFDAQTSDVTVYLKQELL